LSGLLFSPSLSRFSHSRCNFSASPPNSSTSFRESFRDAHAISSCNLLHPGLEMIASLPYERVCRIFSRALSQCGATAFRHRYMDWGSTRVSRVWRLPTLSSREFFETHHYMWSEHSIESLFRRDAKTKHARRVRYPDSNVDFIFSRVLCRPSSAPFFAPDPRRIFRIRHYQS